MPTHYTVLGATGFIGRHLTDWLRTQGHAVATPGRDEILRTKGSLGRVLYAIGLTADFRAQPLATAQAHVSLLAELLGSAEFDSLVYLSSTRVYAGASSGAEDARLSVRSQEPADLYNLSKLMGESLCLHGGRANARVARVANVVGPGKCSANDFLVALAREAKTGHVRLRSDPASAKDYIHVADLPPLLARLAAPDCLHQVYNVASGVQIRHAQWLERLVSRTGCRVSVEADAPLQSFPPIAVNRIADEFGFQARDALAGMDCLLE